MDAALPPATLPALPPAPPADSISSLASHPKSLNFDVDHRNTQLAYLQSALARTIPPVTHPHTPSDYVPTSISMVGPGNYGVKEVENGEEVVLLNDDVLTSVANATVVIIDGNDLERITVLYQFPQFLEHCPHESIHLMVPRICIECTSWNVDSQIAAIEALYFVVNVKVPFHIANQIVYSCLQITSHGHAAFDENVDATTNNNARISDADDTCKDSVANHNLEDEINNSGYLQIFDACSEIISTLLPQVHRYNVLQNIVPELIDRCCSANVHQRRFVSRILGALDNALTSDELDVLFVKSALRLSNDEDETVRSLISQSMSSIASKVDISITEKHLWPKLHDLILHDTVSVKINALRALAKSAEAHKQYTLTSKSFEDIIMPVFINECKQASQVASDDLRVVSDDIYLVLEVFSEIYGYLVTALAPLLTTGERWPVTLHAFRLMVTCNGPTVRHWCSFNMPAIATLCFDDKSVHINSVIPSLAGDTDLETRSTLAAGILELTKSLRTSALRNDVVRAVGMLFMDENAQVRMNALGHFSKLLRLLSKRNKNVIYNRHHHQHHHPHTAVKPLKSTSSTQQDDENNNSNEYDIRLSDDIVIRSNEYVLADDGADEEEMQRLAPMFSSLELMSFDSWRTQKLLAEEVEKSSYLIPQEMLCEHVAPLLFQMARESTYLVRKASMRSLIHVLRYVPDVRRRNHILKHFKLEWAQGKVYWTRLSFIEACECAFALFSLRLFNALFKDQVLLLRHDRVVNVRLRLLKFLRHMAPVWNSTPEFRDAVDHLAADGDWQVSNEARDLCDSLAHGVQEWGEEVKRIDSLKEQAELTFFKHTKQKKRKAKAHKQSGTQNNTTTSREVTLTTEPNQSDLFTSEDFVTELDSSIHSTDIKLITPAADHQTQHPAPPQQHQQQHDGGGGNRRQAHVNERPSTSTATTGTTPSSSKAAAPSPLSDDSGAKLNNENSKGANSSTNKRPSSSIVNSQHGSNNSALADGSPTKATDRPNTSTNAEQNAGSHAQERSSMATSATDNKNLGQRTESRQKKSSFWTLLCRCFGGGDG